MLMTTPHSWAKIRENRQGRPIIGAARVTAQQLAEYDKDMADLLAEGKRITDRAEAEKRDLTAAEVDRLAAIMDEDDGEFAQLQAKRDKAAKVMALAKRSARAMGDLKRNRYSGLVSADEEEGDEDCDCDPDDEDCDCHEDEDEPKMKKSKPANRLRKASRRPKLRDAAGNRLRVAMGGERLFSHHRSTGFGDERPRLAFGDALRAHVRGESSQLTSVGGNGGFLVPELDSGILLDRVRAASIIDRIGAASLVMEGPECYVTQILEDPAAHWQRELAVTKASNVSFSRLKLEAHTVRCLIPLSGEFLADSLNGADVVTSTAIKAMAAAIDLALLKGSGVGAEPLGVLNSPGIQTVESIGYPFDDRKFSAGVGKIMQEDFPGDASELSLVMNPATAGVMDNLRDSEGRILDLTPWVRSMPKYVSSSLPSGLGVGEDESEAAILHGPSILIGWRSMVEGRLFDAGVAVGENGERFEAPSQDVRFLVLQARVGIAILRPSWQCVLSGIKTVEPPPGDD